MYEYNAQGPEELELAPGDLLVVVQKVDDVSSNKLSVDISPNYFFAMSVKIEGFTVPRSFPPKCTVNRGMTVLCLI